MTRWRTALTVLLALPVHHAGAAGEDPSPPRPDQARIRRLEFMKAKVAELTLETDAEPIVTLTLADAPALRWTNPVRGAGGDGATFFWLRGTRPAAVATVSIRDGGKVFRELALLADEPLTCRRGAQTVWSPRKNVLPFRSLENSPVPASSGALRLAQMRDLARRFRVSLIKGKPVESRLLSRPLARYEDTGAGILDGAVFSFAEGTDPEALVLLESRRDAAHPDGGWFYSIGRMSAPPLEVRLDSRLIWSCQGYWKSPRSPEDAYSEAHVGIYGEAPE